MVVFIQRKKIYTLGLWTDSSGLLRFIPDVCVIPGTGPTVCYMCGSVGGIYDCSIGFEKTCSLFWPCYDKESFYTVLRTVVEGWSGG